MKNLPILTLFSIISLFI